MCVLVHCVVEVYVYQGNVSWECLYTSSLCARCVHMLTGMLQGVSRYFPVLGRICVCTHCICMQVQGLTQTQIR